MGDRVVEPMGIGSAVEAVSSWRQFDDEIGTVAQLENCQARGGVKQLALLAWNPLDLVKAQTGVNGKGPADYATFSFDLSENESFERNSWLGPAAAGLLCDVLSDEAFLAHVDGIEERCCMTGAHLEADVAILQSGAFEVRRVRAGRRGNQEAWLAEQADLIPSFPGEFMVDGRHRRPASTEQSRLRPWPPT